MEKNNKRKVPIRLCLGCNTPHPKQEMIRIVRDKEGQISIDFSGKKNGRGAYICNDAACLAKLRKNKRLKNALGVEVSSDIYDTLEKEFADETK